MQNHDTFELVPCTFICFYWSRDHNDTNQFALSSHTTYFGTQSKKVTCNFLKKLTIKNSSTKIVVNISKHRDVFGAASDTTSSPDGLGLTVPPLLSSFRADSVASCFRGLQSVVRSSMMIQHVVSFCANPYDKCDRKSTWIHCVKQIKSVICIFKELYCL